MLRVIIATEFLVSSLLSCELPTGAVMIIHNRVIVSHSRTHYIHADEESPPIQV